MPKKITREIPPGSKPRRLDVVLHQMKIFSSRSQAKRAIDDGLVKLIGAEAKAAQVVKAGDRFEVFLPDPKPATPLPEDIPLNIIYEDRDILVIDKPGDIVVHPGAGNFTGTLVNAVLFHCRDLSGIGGVLRPGVVHRLDKETSGVMVMAKNDAAHQSLSKQFQDREVEKTYLAIIMGRMRQPQGVIESPIGRHPNRRTKMSGLAKKGRHAVTSWKEIEVFPGAGLIELTPLTGRTHQIRVHLSEAGRPIVGDKIYAKRKQLMQIQNNAARAALANIKRQALHAHRLSFNHPSSKKRMTFTSPLPEDMQRAVEALRHAGSGS